MLQLLITAFTMGVLGSFHCVGMCGPIALSLPINDKTAWLKFFSAFVYNLGRVFTYAVFGLVFGFLGKTFALFGLQQGLSILLGVLIIVVVLFPKQFSLLKNNNIILLFFSKIRLSLAKFFNKKKYSSLFSIGLLNGLLPCGLVYMAIAGAVITANIFSSTLFMIFFGLGTLPMMWSIAFLGNYVSIGIRQKIKKIYPYILLLMACMLILRGLGLGIKYLSPKLDAAKQSINCNLSTVH